MTLSTLNTYALIWIAFGILLFPFLFKIKQPYGRHIAKGWGPLMDNKLGWILQELPSPIFLSIFFFMHNTPKPLIAYLLWFLWVLHYFYRSVIFPLRTKTTGKKIPVLIVLFAIGFNFINGFLNGTYLGDFFSPNTDSSLLFFARICIGAIVFFTGVFINHQADNILLNLRKPGETDYKIPTGGLYKYISCPNYFGEMIEWLGFAIMAWSLPALSFAVWTVVNLAPRAFDHHKWYQEKFADYSKERKALIPKVL